MRSEPAEAEPKGIDYFGRGHWLSRVQARMSVGARRRMFELWRAWAGPTAGKTVLDLGSTPDEEREDSNCMLPWLHEAGMKVTLYSFEDLSNLKPRFPFAEILPPALPGKVPAADGAYDWVTCSAVLEHAGGLAGQTALLRDCGRLARRGVFLTTPNRGHWLEFHTKLPLLHWLPRPLHGAALKALGKGRWADEGLLRLVGRGELRALAREALGPGFDVQVRAVWTLGMPSNLVLLARRK